MKKVLLYIGFVTGGGLRIRTTMYECTGALLCSRAGNDEKDPPMGLSKIREADLPKLGGILGEACVGRTVASVIGKLTELHKNKMQEAMKVVERATRLLAELDIARQAMPPITHSGKFSGFCKKTPLGVFPGEFVPGVPEGDD